MGGDPITMGDPKTIGGAKGGEGTGNVKRRSNGDLKGKLKDDPRHPAGRNSYAHICSLIISKFGCSYKEVNSNKVLELKRFISEINE